MNFFNIYTNSYHLYTLLIWHKNNNIIIIYIINTLFKINKSYDIS